VLRSGFVKTISLAAAQTLLRATYRLRHNAVEPKKKGFLKNHFFGAGADAAAGYVLRSAEQWLLSHRCFGSRLTALPLKAPSLCATELFVFLCPATRLGLELRP